MQRPGAVSQRSQSVPDGQAQKKSPSKLMQLALLRHGCNSQKLMSFCHLCPVQPVQQIKLKLIKRRTKMDKFKYLVGKCI